MYYRPYLGKTISPE